MKTSGAIYSGVTIPMFSSSYKVNDELIYYYSNFTQNQLF
jgi:hypothetical protein